MSERKSFAVDQNFHQENVFLEQVLLRSAIDTSEFLVLTQDTAYDPKSPGVCFVAGTADYTVRGDVVRIVGPIACPGRSLKIVCRVLQLYPDSQLRPAAIVVDGKSGQDGEPVGGMPQKGADGVEFGDYGQQGENGNAGNDGQKPEAGGTVALFCGALSLKSDVTVSAKGGGGGGGSAGTDGGTGGRGHNGFNQTIDDRRLLVETAGIGGRGGHGGPGGAGNNGGHGGSITLHYGGSIPTDRKFSLSVKGGDGGQGEHGGNGGQGGATGSGHRFDYPLFPGGDGGDAGPGGKGGYGGKGGRLTIANDSADTKGLTLDCAHGSHGAEGKAGKKGSDGAAEPERHVMPVASNSGFQGRSEDDAPPAPRASQATSDADSKTDGSLATARFRYEALRQHVALGQLRMVLERLRSLYLRLGRADLNLDPTQQNPDLIELLAGLQWIQDLLGSHDDQIDQIDAAFRDSWDGAIYFFRGGTCLRYDAATRKALAPPASPIGDTWPRLWADGGFDTVTLGHWQHGFDDDLMPRYGGVGMFFKSRDVIFHFLDGGCIKTGPLEDMLGKKHDGIWNGIDMAVNVADDGEQGYLFKGDNYYKYTLGRQSFRKVEGPSSISADFPGLWRENVTAAFTGDHGRVFLFQKRGTYDDQHQYHPPQYMVYNFDIRKIEPGYPKDIAKDWPGLTEDDFGFTGAGRTMAAALLHKANSLYQNLNYEMDYFGNTSTYVALETVDYFHKAKEEALTHLKGAEKEYRKYQSDMNQSAESTAGLQLAVRVTGARHEAIEKEAKAALASAQAALAEINRLRGLLDARGQALATDAGALKDEVRSQWGVSWQDLFGCLTQFSFMHWANLPEKVESGPILMAAGQVGDLFQKGISNVVSDSGQSMNKTYVVRRVDSLTQGIKSLKDLTLTRGKFIDPNNLYNDAYKLTVTRDQFKELCDDFTGQFKSARKIIHDLDEYVTLADQRNAAVLDYNQSWQRVGDLQAEAVKAELDLQQAQSGLAGQAQPNLPVFTSFATERYNRAKDQTLHIYYLAGRAYILKSLEVRDRFSEVLSALPATGQINAATFDLKSLDDLYNEIMDELRSSGPTGPRTEHVVFRKDTHPEMFAALARDGVASFAIQQATSDSDTGSFAEMANVRLTRVRCWAGGLAPGRKHSFRLVHTGRETFVTSGDEEVTVDHDPVTLDYAYLCDSVIDPTADRFKFQGEEWPMALTGRYSLIGPFTIWNILLDDKTDRAAVTSLRVEFDVVHQAFTPHAPST